MRASFYTANYAIRISGRSISALITRTTFNASDKFWLEDGQATDLAPPGRPAMDPGPSYCGEAKWVKSATERWSKPAYNHNAACVSRILSVVQQRVLVNANVCRLHFFLRERPS